MTNQDDRVKRLGGKGKNCRSGLAFPKSGQAGRKEKNLCDCRVLSDALSY